MNKLLYHPAVKFFAAFGAYFVAAKLGLSLSASEHASPIWPASGIAVAIVTMLGPQYSGAIALGAFLVNFLFPTPFLAAGFIALGNTTEALVAVLIMKKIIYQNGGQLSHRKPFAVILSSIAAPVLSATLGTAAVFLSTRSDYRNILSFWGTWWLGDALGILISLPILYLRQHSSKAQRLEQAALLLSFGALSYWSMFFTVNFSALLILYPALLLITLRSSFTQLWTSVIALMVIGVWAITQHQGPFAQSDLGLGFINFQLFMASVIVTALTLESVKFSKKIGVAATAMLATWALTSILITLFEKIERRRQELDFKHTVELAMDDVNGRMQLYENAL